MNILLRGRSLSFRSNPWVQCGGVQQLGVSDPLLCGVRAHTHTGLSGGAALISEGITPAHTGSKLIQHFYFNKLADLSLSANLSCLMWSVGLWEGSN